MNVEQAIENPSSVFSSPDDVLNNAELTMEEKIKVLKSWEVDAREMLTADEENMPDRLHQETTENLQAIHNALLQLNGG